MYAFGLIIAHIRRVMAIYWQSRQFNTHKNAHAFDGESTIYHIHVLATCIGGDTGNESQCMHHFIS